MKNKNIIMGITIGTVMAIIWSFCFIKVLNSLAEIIIGYIFWYFIWFNLYKKR